MNTLLSEDCIHNCDDKKISEVDANDLLDKSYLTASKKSDPKELSYFLKGSKQ